jgi:hypothetical protein
MSHPLQPYLKHRRLDRLWKAYKKSVADGDIPSLSALGLSGLGSPSRLGFTGKSEEAQAEAIETLEELWLKICGKDAPAMQEGSATSEPDEKERRVFELGMAFLQATATADLDQMRELKEAGVPVNFQHPTTKQTALHIATACASKGIVEFLVDTGECDYLIPDNLGKIPWENTYFFRSNPEIEQLVLEGTKAQAARESVDLLKEFRAKVRTWAHQDWYKRAIADGLGSGPGGVDATLESILHIK